MRKFALILAFAAAGLCSAETWDIPYSYGWYTPKSYSYMEKDYSFAVVDKNGAEKIIKFNADGSNADEVINSIDSTVKSVFRNLVNLSNLTIANARRLDEVDEEFWSLADNLDWVMMQIISSLDTIQLQMQDNQTATLKRTGDMDNVTYVATGLGVKDDGRSTQVRTVQTTGDQQVSIRNFAAGGGCAENLSEMMTKSAKAGERGRHTLLSRYDRGGTPELHYLPLGDMLDAVAGVKVYGEELEKDDENKVDINNLVKSITANGVTLSPNAAGVVDLGNLNTVTQNVLTVSGTQGAGGSGQKVRFESMEDSNVKIDVSTDANGVIVIKLGVYYLQ